jgi:two-component system, chemotaxis family, CheB/CheR fusion protein
LARDSWRDRHESCDPHALHDVGLVAATRWLAEDLHRSYGLLVDVAESEELALDETARIKLFRAIRELLINVSKHAGVDRARVQIRREGDLVSVLVEDGGVGFGRDTGRDSFGREVGRGGFGLLALRERIEQLGGTLAIGSGPHGTGSRVVVKVPLRTGEGDPS